MNKYIRGQLSEWKKQSMISCKYQCIFTGAKEFQIHHTYPVNRILDDIFKKYNIQDKNFQEYSQNELDYILELFLEEQDKHPLCVCIRKDIHDLYHTIYGKTTNNKNQWNKFVKEYREGIYSDIA